MPTQITVPFYGANLIVASHQNQPYVPMKPIVEGMGMDWASQFKKLKNNPERWGIVVTTIPSMDSNNGITCIPLRKLFGWLNTIQPNRVREEVRAKVIQYQNECDDVLWQYWADNTKPQQPELPSPKLELPKPSRQLQFQQHLMQLAQLRGQSAADLEAHYTKKYNRNFMAGDETELALINAHLKSEIRDELKKATPQVRKLKEEASAQGMKLVAESDLHMAEYVLSQQQQMIEKLSRQVINLNRKTQELLEGTLFQ